MLKKELKVIKESIRTLIHERTACNELIAQRIERVQKQIEEYKEEYKGTETERYFLKEITDRKQNEINEIPYNTCEEFGNEISLHIIYDDGSEYCGMGVDIVCGKEKPKMQHIVYASYMDGYIEFDTETGELNYDVSEDDQFEAYEEYKNQIEIKFNTTWGRNHKQCV